MDNLYEIAPGLPNCPVYAPGERYAFYINFDTPISDVNFGTFRLDIYQGATQVLTNVALLQKDIITGLTYNIYSIFDFPALRNGYFQFVITDTSDNSEKARSNFILVENDATYYKRAPYVMFRNEENFYGFNYENLIDFFNIFRLSLIETDYQYDLQKTQYRNASDKRLRNLKSYRYKYRKIESYYFDEDGHDAASVMYEHDGIYIDAVKYETKDAYAVVVDALNHKKKGEVNAYVDDPNLTYVFPINQVTIGDGNGGGTINIGVIHVPFGDSHLSVVGGKQVYTAQLLIGLPNKPVVKATQLGGDAYLRNEDYTFDAVLGAITIQIDSFLLTPGDELIIWPYILNPDSL